MQYKLTTPVTREDLAPLRAGDTVLLSGVVYTARDAAHKRMMELLDAGQPLPFPVEGSAVYYVGPTPERPGEVIGSAGPTTSGRMDPYSPRLLDLGQAIMIGKGASARSIRLDLPKFTLVGATTRAGMLTAPLRDRFGVVTRMEYYTVEELKMIILRSAKVLEVGIDENGAYAMARRSRGTPRLANRLLKRVRDFAQVKYDGRITYDVACFALNLLEVDQYGLDKLDRQILTTLIVNFKGGPVGLDTLAAAIGEDSGTLEDVYEPYLLKNGFLNRTPRGRMASALAYEHLGFPVPEI